jgi:hypothetical protein
LHEECATGSQELASLQSDISGEET